MTSNFGRELICANDAARAAGKLVLELRKDFTQKLKPDGSIVTSADLASADLIRERLKAEFPQDAVLTEEDADNDSRVAFSRCWIVDPIDGTTAYVSGSDDFDIYIALVENGIPVVAVTYQPVFCRFISSAAQSGVWLANGSTWQPIAFPHVQTPPVIVTRHWLGAPANLEWVQDLARRIDARAMRAASGISPRTFLEAGVDAIIGRSATERPISAKEWDVAPLDLIVREAGGWSSDLLGRPLVFNKPNPVFPSGILLARTHSLGEKIIAAIAQ